MSKIPHPNKKDLIKVKASGIFGFVLFAFFVYVIIFVPSVLPEFKQRILAIFSGLFSGLFVYFLAGDIILQSKSIKTPFGKISIKTTGGVAVFILVIWWWFSPLAPVSISDGIYRVRVTVLDPQQILVDDAMVSSSVGEEPLKVAGGWQIEIPANNKPLDGKIIIFASKKSTFLVGKYELVLENDPNPAITVQMAKDKSAYIRGIVTDEKGKAIPGAKMSVVGYEKETVTTSPNGDFVLQAHAAEGEKVLLHIETEKHQPLNEWYRAGDKPITIILDKK